MALPILVLKEPARQTDGLQLFVRKDATIREDLALRTEERPELLDMFHGRQLLPNMPEPEMAVDEIHRAGVKIAREVAGMIEDEFDACRRLSPSAREDVPEAHKSDVGNTFLLETAGQLPQRRPVPDAPLHHGHRPAEVAAQSANVRHQIAV
jgi:hypothetical protein